MPEYSRATSRPTMGRERCVAAGTGMQLTLHGGLSPMGSQAHRLMGCLFHPCGLAPEGGAPAYWTVTPSPGERGSLNSGSSGAHLVQGTVVLFPVGPIHHGTRKHYSVGEVQSVLPST